MALASSYTVSGAGTTADNGVYTPNGAFHNGVAVFQNPGGKYLYANKYSTYAVYRWAIDTAVIDRSYYDNNYYCSSFWVSGSDVIPPDSGTWATGSGSSPAPTVTAGGSAGNHTNFFF